MRRELLPARVFCAAKRAGECPVTAAMVRSDSPLSVVSGRRRVRSQSSYAAAALISAPPLGDGLLPALDDFM